MAVVRSFVLLVFLAFLLPGCGEDCDCSSLPGILIEVVDIEPSGSVEVCYDQQCGEVDLRDVDSDTADEAYVPFDDLGGPRTGHRRSHDGRGHHPRRIRQRREGRDGHPCLERELLRRVLDGGALASARGAVGVGVGGLAGVVDGEPQRGPGPVGLGAGEAVGRDHALDHVGDDR